MPACFCMAGSVACASGLPKFKQRISEKRIPSFGQVPDDHGVEGSFPASRVLKLRDGRQLGYIIMNSEVPSQSTQVIFIMHGTPGCRLDAAFLSNVWKLPNTVCCIGIDRPGIGLSSFQPGRRVVDIATDVIELADALGVKRFGVFGISGGGPYVAACAARIPTDRLAACFDCSGQGALNISSEMLAGVPAANRFLLK